MRELGRELSTRDYYIISPEQTSQTECHIYQVSKIKILDTHISHVMIKISISNPTLTPNRT
jgi:hypothetical protein